MLALAWQWRFGCAWVVLQQAALVALGVGILGLTGLAIDYIRWVVEPASAQPRWPPGVSPPSDWPPLAVVGAIAGAVLVLALLQGWVRYRAAVSVAHLTQQIVIDLRTRVYDKLQRLSFRFFDAHQSGSIINRITADVQAVRMFIDNVLIQALVTVLTLAVYLGYMFAVHVPLTLACLATTPAIWWATVWFARSTRPMYQKNRELADQLTLALSENVQGIQVVKAFHREAEQIDKFADINRQILDGKYAVFHRLSIFQPGTGLLTQLNLVVLLAYGGWLVRQGALLLGEGLFVFANLLQQFATQIGQLANIGNTIQASITGAQRVFEILDAPIEVQNAPQPVRVERARGEVRFENVSFGYDRAHPVLHAIDFEAKPGECIAIVGPTGAGKSTLMSLLPRFYDPLAGRVLIDGRDARELDVDDLRRNIGLVFQESFLFSHTVAANISFGCPHATPEQIERAARLAAAHDFIMRLPDGYQTVIGEYGCNLSGGERQRLAIARALLLDPAILILDDATTAVDPETERAMLDALESAMAGRTTFVIAHRLSTLRRASRVIVLQAGRIVQQGTHASLLTEPGYYHQAAMHQAAAELANLSIVVDEAEEDAA
ncbi:MAG: ABC transporter ATP-binding protein [Planctomycetes bacterium]|nr:ABC transporter ATP-binding protein [Planctomycetota bacterium]